MAEEIGRLPGASPAKGLGRINAASKMAGNFFKQKNFPEAKILLAIWKSSIYIVNLKLGVGLVGG